MKLSPAAMAGVALSIGIAVCAVVVFLGPGAAEMLIPLLGAAQSENYPLIETMFVVVLFGGMTLIAIVVARLMGMNALRLGTRPFAALLLGILIGAGGLLAATGYAALSGTLVAGVGGNSGAAMLLWGLAVVLVQAGAEEVYFRGWLQPVVQRAWGGAIAVVVVSVAFGALHVMGGARAPLSLINLYLGGIMFGLLALRGRGIAAALGAHVAWNASEQLLVGLDPNPGTGSFGSAIDYELAGRALWGGSEEGLNASIAMTFALLAVVVPLAMGLRRADARDAIPAAATG